MYGTILNTRSQADIYPNVGELGYTECLCGFKNRISGVVKAG